MVEASTHGKSVSLPELGSFSANATPARTGMNSSTLERIQIPAGQKVASKVASTLKSSL
ncbi:HU family DNA-binding protein [Deinococcus sp. Arct2-2]|uniref:HU family DNA-binding protein n=1 Tax=Deinococcus sp. Arct2-2 TaxID=2568653 RepID=UPI003211CE87